MIRTPLTIFFFLLLISLYAQSSDHFVITAQGSFETGASFSLSWTIGDLVTETTFVENSIITQGFQQPIIIVEENPVGKDTLDASIYPNPTDNTVTLVINNGSQEYYMDLFNIEGKLLWRGKSNSSREEIDLYDLPAAQYLLRVRLNEQLLKTFQITKGK